MVSEIFQIFFQPYAIRVVGYKHSPTHLAFDVRYVNTLPGSMLTRSIFTAEQSTKVVDSPRLASHCGSMAMLGYVEVSDHHPTCRSCQFGNMKLVCFQI